MFNNDEDTGDRIKAEYRRLGGDAKIDLCNVNDRLLALAARAVLQKPVATPSLEQIKQYLRGVSPKDTPFASTADIVAGAFAYFSEHFAPAREPVRMQIEGMALPEIEKAMCKDFRSDLKTLLAAHALAFDHAARVAHRLANTPIEVAPDPDAEAKRLHQAYIAAVETDGAKIHWGCISDEERSGWRAVAAAQKAPAP